MADKLLITGAGGLIGSELSKRLLAEGYNLVYLSTSRQTNKKAETYYWNPLNNEIDVGALDGVSSIIHLAGAGIADNKWTSARKKLILESRIKGSALLASVIKNKGLTISKFIGASAIGFYGMKTVDHVFTENDEYAKDFLGETCYQWEKSYSEINALDKSIIRIGVVLSTKGGALEKLIPLHKLGLGSALGNGKQFVPWIHIDDLIEIFLFLLMGKSKSGIYNAVAPSLDRFNDLSLALAKALHRPHFFPNVPSFAIRWLYGEMAQIVLQGSAVSAQKLLSSGYNFQFPVIGEAIAELLKQKK